MSLFSPNYPFVFNFYDEMYERQYISEQKSGELFNIFSAVALIIGCLGLFGLASFIPRR